MELGAVHRLLDSDPATSQRFHRIPWNQAEDREAPRRLGGGKTRHACK